MYLKSIEVQGFKSFANKIVFEFHNGITGIVGPNGSGKSNVADAVRWVLGEQRIKQLRGASMQDVIFSGTETRKPQGFAYVAITLDNSDHQLAIDYEQVTVSRRIYRSGESEYMINGSACRLKDINELFYDTGIGKEGYSIIGQGQIDKILSGKPEERRELFDEAAGIVKFKRRKAIAQKKLEDEKQNLVRLNDILTELEKQVGPLAKQSEAAREYLRLKEELKRYDVNQFLMETEALKAELQGLEEKDSIVEKDLEETKAAAEEGRKEYEALDEALAQLDEAIAQNGRSYNQAVMTKSSLEGQINVLNEQIRTETLNAEHIDGRMASIHADIGGKQEQIGQYEEERSQIRGDAHHCLELQTAAEKAVQESEDEINRLDARIEGGKQAVIDALNEKSGLTAKQQRYEAMSEQVGVRRSEVCQKLLKFKSDESVQDEQLAAQKEQLGQIRARIDGCLEAREQAEERGVQLDQEVRRLHKKLNDTQQEYHTSYTKLESLKNIAERYEGYGNSIRRVMEVKDRIRGIHGVVADLIAVPKQYEIAIETALGGSIQNIVTDSEQTAKQLIEYLKKNKYGRATFLPLTGISDRGSFNQERALKEPGVLGLAHELVEVDAAYRDLCRYLLGRVVVVDEIDHAIALARKYNHTLRIVTLEGELLNAGGSMTGGAFKNTSNLLGRRREIEELEAACGKALTAVDQLEQDLVMNEALLADNKEETERINADLNSAYLEQNTVQMSIAQTEEKRSEIQESYADLTLENGQLEDQIRQLQESQTQLQDQIRAIEDRGRQTDDAIGSYNTLLEEAKAVREQRAKELASIQLETANLQQKEHFASENIRRVRDELCRLEEELAGLTGGTDRSKQIIEEKQQEIGRIQDQIGELSGQIGQLDALGREQTAVKEEKTARQKEIFKKREELSGRVSLLDKEAFRLQSQKEKLDERLESQTDYMWSEYELTYSTAAQLRDEELLSLPEIKKQISVLKEAIRRLGNVNVNAIEDYKEVSERYEFMKTQHDDLVAAEETLMGIIDELDTGMRRQFEEKFKEIRLEFDKVFKELFGGGRGALELVEDEDILEAGIQIISQPPGKKLQNMMQLSGGEKALTAIALLFAIQNLKPSPFCLLDEIEAALDDSNVDRFAKYLHKLTKYTQFIVITHRRGTMVAADRLYGITMQEKGISTLVSVNLIEEQLDQ